MIKRIFEEVIYLDKIRNDGIIISNKEAAI